VTRPTRARIDLSAIRANYRYAKSLAPDARALAVVKANGYGHGALAVARTLADQADAFGVACLEEALELRESGVRNPILLLEGVYSPDELAVAGRERLALVAHSELQLDWILAARPPHPLSVWLKMDTGMHRLGLPPQSFAGAYARLRACPHVADIVLMTHFARADELDQPFTRSQMEIFQAHCGDIQAPRSLANSPATLAWPAAHADWVRPGIMLYGASPLPGDPGDDLLRPAMTLESAILAIQQLQPGDAVGYGGRFVCDRPMRIGVVAIGYADGYPRHAVDGTPVAVKGRRTRIVGRVSMDMLTVDLTPIEDAKVGDPVELWGRLIPANAVARASDTIAYALFTGITRRVPLLYQE
jgi:alanine racemase